MAQAQLSPATLEALRAPTLARRLAMAAAAILVAASAAQAQDAAPETLSTPPSQPTVGLHLGSWHSKPGFNNTNPGVYVRTSDGYTAGAYFNSERRPSTYVGRTFALFPHVDLTAGLITGYRLAPVLPMLVPSIHVGPLRVVWIPRVSPKMATHVVHLAYEVQQ